MAWCLPFEGNMSKKSHRPTREARKQHKEKVKEARQALRHQQDEEGLREKSQSVSNALCSCQTVEEEQELREEAVSAQISAFRSMLPKLLKDLAKIADPRQPKKSKHKLTVVLLYGLLAFVFQLASRREANRTLSRPAFLQTLHRLFPELESLPHADTLHRLLERIEVSELEMAHVGVVRRLIRNKKFQRFLINRCYPIAIDGTQKLVREGRWYAEGEWLERVLETSEGEKVQQYVYVLEANLVFHTGLSLPLLSEFLSYDEGDLTDKQDSELKAFKRLAARLKGYFPRLPIVVLLDGLYPNGPLMEQCQGYDWEYMIVFPDKCLSSVWKKVEALRPALLSNQHQRIWRGRRQRFWWVNHIEYSYDSGDKPIAVHVVVCEESWEEVDRERGEIVEKHARHAWISSNPVHKNNVHERCNLGARYRWGIETSLQIEKRRGYYYEHAFSYTWNAMKGYHYLMRLAHLINAITQYTKRALKLTAQMGIQAFFSLVRETCANRWLSLKWIKHLLATPFQLRLE